MTTFIENIRSAFDAAPEDEKRDSGELVPSIMMMAGFGVIALVLVNWVGTAVLNKAAEIGSCIEGSGAYADNAKASGDNCDKAATTSKNKSFTKDTSYTKRMGTTG